MASCRIIVALLLCCGTALGSDTTKLPDDWDGGTIYVKKCRVDTIGWVAKVCETHFRWEGGQDFGGGCERQDGMVVSSVGDKLVWLKKEKPPEFHWVVRTKKVCWYEPFVPDNK
jgi:hypothetical protein